MKSQTFIFAGRSGSGKGTQVELLKKYISEHDSERAQFHFYAGSGFRKFIKEGESYSSQRAREINNEGGLQPSFLAIWLWTEAFVEGLKGGEHIFIDGSPRTLLESEALDTAITFYQLENVHVISLKTSREASVERLLSRGRGDDEKEAIERRVSWYDSNVKPAIDYYRDKSGYNFIEVDGEQSIEDVHNDIVTHIESYLS